MNALMSLLTSIPVNTEASNLDRILALVKDNLGSIQLLHFFLISYLISRLFVRYKIPELFLYWLFEKKQLSLSKLLLILILSTAGLSMIIANVVTLLALLPMIVLIQNELKGTDKEIKRNSTMIMLAAVWGANIGGMGMLTGTPANGVFVGMMNAFKFPESASFTFVSWLTWAIPLVFLLCLCGWGVLLMLFRPNHCISGTNIRRHLVRSAVSQKAQRLSFAYAAFFLLSSAVLSYLMGNLREQAWQVYLATVAWTLIYLVMLFVAPVRLFAAEKRSPLLNLPDIVRDLPWKGLMWMGIGLMVTGVLYYLGVPRMVAEIATRWVSVELSLLLLMLCVGLVATFLTEIVSNLVVQFALFATLFPFSRIYPNLSWQMMLIITLTSGCAFMTPIATPVNGLGFGASRKMSLLSMLGAGAVMNVFSAVLIAVWVHFLVPVVIGWFS